MSHLTPIPPTLFKMSTKRVSLVSILISIFLIEAVLSELIINVRLNQQQGDKNFDVLDENGLTVQNFPIGGDESDSIGFLRYS